MVSQASTVCTRQGLREGMRHFWAVLVASLFFCGCAAAQGVVQQSGPIVPFHVPVWGSNGVIMDGGSPQAPAVSALGMFNGSQCPFGISSQAGPNVGVTPYSQFTICQTLTTSTLTFSGLNGASPPTVYFNIGGVNYAFPGPGNGNVSGPSSTTTGHFACWNNSAGTLLVDCGGPPGTASTANTGTSGTTLPFLNGANTFSGTDAFTGLVTIGTGTAQGSVGQIFESNAPAPPGGWNGYASLYDPNRFDLGGFPITWEEFGNASPGAQTLVGTINCPSSDVGTAGCFGVSGYAVSATTVNEAVGGFFTGLGNADSTQAWGFNAIVQNCVGTSSCTTNTGHSGNFYGGEVDVNIFKEGGVAPTANVRGLYCTGASETAPTGEYSCIEVANPGQGHGLTPWTIGFHVDDGAAVEGMQIGTTAAGNNVASMPLDMIGRTSGGTTEVAQVFARSTGDAVLQGGADGGAIIKGGFGAGCSVTASASASGPNVSSCPLDVTSIAGSAPITSITAGGSTIIGSGGTVVCASVHVCDNVSGTLTVTTGSSGISAAGTVATVNFSITRATAPNCTVGIQGGTTFLAPGHSESGTTLVLATSVQLSGSSTYEYTYVCGGN
jgi:hypothetical protein